MTPAEFNAKMAEIYADRYDTEAAHVDADELLCEALRSLGGYEEGLRLFEEADKWNA